jgi:cytochrome c553
VTCDNTISKKFGCALIQVKTIPRRNNHTEPGISGMASMRTTVFLILLLGVMPGAAVQAAVPAVNLDPQLIAKCQDCHGPAGGKATSATPRLNGQDAGYLFRRLTEFRDPTRGSPHAAEHMWETATNLADHTAAELARYFAAQPATPAAPKMPLATRGGKIYRLGIVGDVPACQSCHGPAGEGRESAPRLAGQRGDYLEEQLSAFMLQLRVSSDMNRHAWHMEPDQFRALRAYLSNDQ